MTHSKSTVDEIRSRFDQDVERFSNLQTGQSATVDAPLALELIASVAASVTPQAQRLLDVGCGAGNYTLKLLEKLPGLSVTLIDLSQPMLTRAVERITPHTTGEITTLQTDIREAELGAEQFDLIVASAVLHHLRTDMEWEAVFAKFHQALRPGGSLWIFDLVVHEHPGVHQHMWARYGDYLTELKDAEYREHVFAYIEQEDTPKSLTYQLQLLQQCGFAQVDVLHKNSCFAAFGGVKGSVN